jgi:hypothetical protein
MQHTRHKAFDFCQEGITFSKRQSNPPNQRRKKNSPKTQRVFPHTISAAMHLRTISAPSPAIRAADHHRNRAAGLEDTHPPAEEGAAVQGPSVSDLHGRVGITLNEFVSAHMLMLGAALARVTGARRGAEAFVPSMSGAPWAERWRRVRTGRGERQCA